jgi:pilus assembly protein CpaF
MSLEAEGVDLPSRAIREIIAAAVHLIVQVARLADGSRRVTSVAEVVEFDEESGTVIVEEIFKLQRGGKGRQGSRPELAFTGYVPNFIDQLLRVEGVTVESLF